MDEWFVCVPGGDPVGPVSASLLILGIRSGKVPDDGLVCRSGEKSWRPLLEVPELLAALPGPDAFRGAERDSRYSVKRLLGKGGMGEVFLCGDDWIGREVAMKVALGGHSAEAHLRARFVREALVQGQLEHPSVVPVYDLGQRPDGATYFTMKRVRGMTLHAIVDGLRRDDPEVKATYSRRKLLTAMSQVCLALSLAHSRGIVHRDLKPENVMLGDYGEVYVLDWGVAKVLEDAWAKRAAAGAAEVPVGRTQTGVLIGTAGYASPEQVRGDAGIGPESDVYALGAILFELLAFEPLHVGTEIEKLVTSTLAAGGGRPSSRSPKFPVPPELDDMCARATALLPEHRFRSAREVHDALERYLDGERDAERRRELGRQHATAAAKAFEAAAKGGKDGEAERIRGLRELSAALALEPSNEAAMRTLMRVLLQSPADLPPEAQAEFRIAERQDRLRAARNGMLVYSLMGVSLPILLSMHVRQPMFLVALIVSAVVTSSYMGWMWLAGRGERRYMRWSPPMGFFLIGLTSTIFGPFVLVPGTAAITVTSFLVSLRADRPTRLLLMAGGISSVLVPAALQFFKIVPPSYAFEHGSVRILSGLVELEPIPSTLLLLFGSCLTIVAAVFTVGQAVDALVTSERRNFAQAWRLRQMLPAVSEGGSVRPAS